VARPLFACFDVDGNGTLDFRELFIGLALLTACSRDEQLAVVFTLIDSNGSGQISREEMLVFLDLVAPATATRREIGILAATIVHEADTSRNGLIGYHEFLAWPGKHTVLKWLEAYHERVLSRFDSSDMPSVSPHREGDYPWSAFSSADILRLFRAESWHGRLSVTDFERILFRLGSYFGDDRTTVQKLFECFDQDGNGSLDFREMFIGLVLLCSESREQRLRAMFTLMDANGSGRISREELESFLHFLWPPSADSMHDCRITLRTSRIMLEADQNRSGLITFDEYMAWPGKDLELKMMDARLISILSNFS